MITCASSQMANVQYLNSEFLELPYKFATKNKKGYIFTNIN